MPGKKIKSCDCLDKFDKAIKKEFPDPQACVEWVSDLSGNSWPRLVATYRKPTKGGFTKKVFEKTIVPTYCPFCGKKYNNLPE